MDWAYSRVWLDPSKYLCEYMTQEEGIAERPPIPDHLDPWAVNYAKQRKSALTHSQFEELTDTQADNLRYMGQVSRKERREKEERRQRDIEAWRNIPKAEKLAKLEQQRKQDEEREVLKRMENAEMEERN